MDIAYRVILFILMLAYNQSVSALEHPENELRYILSQMASYQVGDTADWRMDLLAFTRQLPESQKQCGAISKVLIEFMRSDATITAKRELLSLLQAVVTDSDKPALVKMLEDDLTHLLALEVLQGAGLMVNDRREPEKPKTALEEILADSNPQLALCVALENAKPGTRRELIRAIYMLPDSEGIGARILAIEDLSVQEVEHVLRVSSQVGDESVLDKLREWLSNTGSITDLQISIDCLAMVGDAKDVPALLELAEEGNPLNKSAVAAIESMPGTEVDAALVQRLLKAPVDEQLILMKVIAARNISQSADALLELTRRPETRIKAIESLSLVASTQILDELIQLRGSCSDPAEIRAVDQAFYRLLARQRDPAIYLPRLKAIQTNESPKSLKAVIRRIESGQ